jgi:hypothetical protein
MMLHDSDVTNCAVAVGARDDIGVKFLVSLAVFPGDDPGSVVFPVQNS